MEEYYRERAAEYDRIYDKPERQADLATLRGLLPPLVASRSVLEIACGTGYWTTALASSARSVLATDVNESTLAVARTRSYDGEVTFATADAFDLAAIPGTFDAIFAGFFWSHVPRADVRRFIDGLLERAPLVILTDNRYVEGSSSPITRTAPTGDTYQTRRLSDGREYEVLKNFPTGAADVAPGVVEWTELTYFWLAVVGGTGSARLG
ncbi:class I SAM-dependent methyltransferase [Kribbella sp. NPDC005582]|uniref:class I SAM-dependent methyltransferase n=1 Tax=Kribbella sp. NPDC005582 TaxID=3156893 RepID=UPI0033A6F049